MTPIYTLPTTEKQKATERRVKKAHLRFLLFCIMAGYSILVALSVIGALIVNAIWKGL